MEGLLIAEVLADIGTNVHERLSWRFPDPYTFILPLGKKGLWLFNRPPNPRIAFEDGYPSTTTTFTSFQDLLVAKVAGKLEKLEQDKLDRVVRLHFGAGGGFVPTPPVTLIAELTGRNCNLILINDKNIIMGAAREISADINRFRQVKAGGLYNSPPPYDKLDPRVLKKEDLAQLEGKTLKKLRGFVDGFGPSLTEALAISSGISLTKTLELQDLEALYPVMQRIAKEPSQVMREALELPDVETLRKREERQSQLERLKVALEKKETLVSKQLQDIYRALKNAQEVDSLKQQADVLMAYQHQVKANATKAELTDFEGQPLVIQLNPKLTASANAEQFYQRIKKRQARAEQSLERKQDLEDELKNIQSIQARLEEKNEKELKVLLNEFVPQSKKQTRLEPGIRYKGPLGYNIIVGRNARENDIVSFKIAKSRDIWLHVQGYTGSHVIIQANNKDVPFEVLLFAAQLAAAYSKAGGSENVPVDYTLRKNVWKVKGAPAGAVHYTQQKTVYVTPNRRPELS